MLFELSYGVTPLNIRLPQAPDQILLPKDLPGASDGLQLCREALDRPLGMAFPDLAKAGRVCIVIADRYRTYPQHLLLQAIMERLEGRARDSVTILVGNGNHPPDLLESFGYPSEWFQRFRWVHHQSGETGILGKVGTTSAGTEVWLNRSYLEADCRIVLGNVKPHYFAGFAGGAKGVFPGLGGIHSNRANHRMKSHPRARLGVIAGNPVRTDMEEAVRLAGAPFILNAICNQKKELTAAAAGDMVLAHRRLVATARPAFQVPAEPTDIVLVSARIPLARNLYQLLKVAAAGAKVLKPGGVLILAGACLEGIGPVETVNHGIWEIGVRHAFPFEARLLFVSALPEEEVRKTPFATWAPTVESALETAFTLTGKGASLTVVPDGGDIIPVMPGENPVDWADETETRLSENPE